VNELLPLVSLAVLASAAAILLERGGSAGYGWVTGSEFALVGAALGPVGLDFLSRGLLEALRTVICLAAGWLGLRFGLRLRRSFLRRVPPRVRFASVLESVLACGGLFLLLRLCARAGLLALDDLSLMALAAVGSSSTKSATAWARSRLGARGPVFEAVDAVSTLDDGLAILGVALLLPRLSPVSSHLPPGAAIGLLVTLGLGLAAGCLILLLLGGQRFRSDLGWVALFGVATLASGLAASLGLSSLAVTSVAGVVVARSVHADDFEELTRATERPLVLSLLVLGGASLAIQVHLLVIALVAAGARALAKWWGGGLASFALPRESRRLGLGSGLVGFGGIAFAAAMSLAQGPAEGPREAILAGALGMVVLSDWGGALLLRRFLSRSGALPAPVEAAQ
jgi:hypothetical protein